MVYKSLVNFIFTNYSIGGFILFYKNLRPLLHNETIDPYFFKITQVNSEDLEEKELFIPIAGCVRLVKRFYVNGSESVNPKTGTVFLKPSRELENCCFLYESKTVSYHKASNTPENGGINEVHTAFYLMVDKVKDLSALLTENNRFLRSHLDLQSRSLGVPDDEISYASDYRNLNLFPSREVVVQAYQNCDENIVEKYGTDLLSSETYNGYSDPSLDDYSFDTLKIATGYNFLKIEVDSDCPAWVTTEIKVSGIIDDWCLAYNISSDKVYYSGVAFEFSKNSQPSSIPYFGYLKKTLGSSFPDIIKSCAYEGSEKEVLGLIFNQYPANGFIPDSFKTFHYRWMLMQRPTSAGSDDGKILKNLETVMANVDLIRKTSEDDSLLRELLSKVAELGTTVENFNSNEIKPKLNELTLSANEMLSLKDLVENDLNLTNGLCSQVKTILESLSDLSSKVVSSYKDYLIEAKDISVNETEFFLKLQIAVEQMSNLEQLVGSLTEVQNCVTSLKQINSNLSLNAKIYQEFDKSNKAVSVSNGVNSCVSILNSISSLVNIKGGKSW